MGVPSTMTRAIALAPTAVPASPETSVRAARPVGIEVRAVGIESRTVGVESRAGPAAAREGAAVAVAGVIGAGGAIVVAPEVALTVRGRRHRPLGRWSAAVGPERLVSLDRQRSKSDQQGSERQQDSAM